MSKHTKGPWEMRDVSGAGLQIWAQVDIGAAVDQGSGASLGRLQPLYEVGIRPQLSVGDNGKVYAMLSYETWYQFPTIAFDEMQKANARLIAAAPDLLGACKALLVNLRILGSTGGMEDDIKRLEAAIKKAEGQ